MNAGRSRTRTAENMDNFHRFLSTDEIKMGSERSSASKKVRETLSNHFFPHNYLNNASQTATTGRSGGWLVKLSRIFPFVLREFYYRISTKESPVLNVERNVLVSVCTCGGKWRKLKHLKLVYFLSPSYAYSQSGCQRAKCAHELRIIEIEVLIPLFRLKLFCVSLN